jgi:hypothetical protein
MSSINKPYPLFSMLQWWVDKFVGQSHEAAKRA